MGASIRSSLPSSLVDALSFRDGVLFGPNEPHHVASSPLLLDSTWPTAAGSASTSFADGDDTGEEDTAWLRPCKGVSNADEL